MQSSYCASVRARAKKKKVAGEGGEEKRREEEERREEEKRRRGEAYSCRICPLEFVIVFRLKSNKKSQRANATAIRFFPVNYRR